MNKINELLKAIRKPKYAKDPKTGAKYKVGKQSEKFPKYLECHSVDGSQPLIRLGYIRRSIAVLIDQDKQDQMEAGTYNPPPLFKTVYTREDIDKLLKTQTPKSPCQNT